MDIDWKYECDGTDVCWFNAWLLQEMVSSDQDCMAYMGFLGNLLRNTKASHIPHRQRLETLSNLDAWRSFFDYGDGQKFEEQFLASCMAMASGGYPDYIGFADKWTSHYSEDCLRQALNEHRKDMGFGTESHGLLQ